MEIKVEKVRTPTRKLTAKWTVESQQDLRSMHEFDKWLLWDAVHDIEDEWRKRESARSRNNQRNT